MALFNFLSLLLLLGQADAVIFLLVLIVEFVEVCVDRLGFAHRDLLVARKLYWVRPIESTYHRPLLVEGLAVPKHLVHLRLVPLLVTGKLLHPVVVLDVVP